MKKLSAVSLLLSAILLNTCMTEVVVLTGSISGVVQDAQTKEPLENVSVELSPVGLSKITSKDGAYFFDELAAKEYTLTYTRAEYVSESKSSTVQVRANNVVDVTMEKESAVPVLEVSDTSLDFGENLTTLSLYISNTGSGDLKWSINYEPGWFVCNPLAGTTAKEKSTVVVTASRTQMQKGSHQQSFSISSNGGSRDITVSMQVAGVNLEYSPSELDFGSLETSKKITLTNKGTGTIQYAVEKSHDWIVSGKTSGAITTKDELNVMVSRQSLAPGDYSGNIVIKLGNETYSIPVRMSVPSQDRPVVSLNPVTAITSTGATFAGIISSVGSSKVTSHGFCVSTAQQPTVSDQKFDMGDCSAPAPFSYTATSLNRETTYYVRAYAINSYGTSYSEQQSFHTSGVTGVAVTGVSLDRTSLSIAVDATGQLTATVQPSDATNRSVTWSSSNPGVATVSTGLVTGVSAGSATITVTTADGGKTATCNVTVSASGGSTIPVTVTGVTLNKTTLSMGIGDTEQLMETVQPSNATNKSVTWTSSEESVATVSPAGFVTAVSEGTATITVQTESGRKTATCKVTVIDEQGGVAGILKWKLSKDGTLTISGNGPMVHYDTSSRKAPWDSYKSGIVRIVVENGVTTIGSYAFYGCSNLTSVSLPNTLTQINGSAFHECSKLASIVLPESLESIGGSAFSGCNFKDLVIPDYVTAIGPYAFGYSKSLYSLTIGASVSTIGYRAFEYCYALTTVYVRNSAPPACDSYVFYNIPLSKAILNVPKGSKAAYQKAAPWSSFGYIVEME